MGRPAINLKGCRFGKLEVIEKDGKSNNGENLWKCLCDCGNTHHVATSKLTRKNPTKSCGCAKTTQGGNWGHPLYPTWTSMKSRCHNKKATNYERYGGRGIEVFERWRNSFTDWLEDMGPKPDSSYVMDRIDNDGNYEPDNCRWVSVSENNKNQRPRRPRRLAKDNKTGFEGVSQVGKNSYEAYFTHNKKKVRVGVFKSAIMGAIYRELKYYEFKGYHSQNQKILENIENNNYPQKGIS